ncbi:MAG TPA: type II toxin-antitoxin system RelE/ParE family toxin, partial [Nitrososphaera sp.]|nr:type II toxin-antitoxin system RelE/ParE family toxin [Nitrososphaera sp.]
MTHYRFTSSALAELNQATLHYEEKENGLGGIFLDEVAATVARILTNPNAWHPLSPRTRRCRTHRFPFG